MTNEIPVTIGSYNDANMQNDKLWFVTACTPAGWDNDKTDWIENWLDLADLPYTPANSNKVENQLIKDRYVLASNTNVPIWVIQQDIKRLPNATLTQRDVFRSEIAPAFRPTVGFLRNSEKQVYMNHFGIKE